MFIFDVIGDVLSALGLVTAGGLSVMGIIAFVLIAICAVPVALLTLWTIICVIWFWLKKVVCLIMNKEFTEEYEPPGFSWLERMSGMR